ncbi:hypothetical protein MMYC01_201623 [Madurella mycetomatis]|uniref:Retroviral polymerase SH3-like domain-containing protein n=1 Tax=Madurella mycetomatis TaxID=100816 RepID=A0A175WHS4_9PEZI|nr:hypothetical protein MMYC01_201623 [Madurella mycetomatis]
MLPTKANPASRSPQERLATALNIPESARQPYIRHLRAYFCEAYYYIKPQKRDQSDKFAARAEKGRLIGYADLHGKIYWIWNPATDTIVRASAVRFNEGPDFKPDNDVDTEYKAVFVDTTSEEEEAAIHAQKSITLTHPTRKEQQINHPPDQPELQEQGQEDQQEEEDAIGWFDAQDEIVVKGPSTTATQFPTPEATPEPQPLSSEDQQQQPLDNDDLREIQDDSPIPPNHSLAPYTGHAYKDRTQQTTRTTTESMGGSNNEPTELSTSRPRRGKAKYSDTLEKGYYAKLARGQLPGQNFYTAHLIEPPTPAPPITITLSHIKVDHNIETSRRADFPQNYRQATRLSNFNDY